MKTSTVAAILAAVLLLFASVATAAGYLWSPSDRPSPPTSSALPATWPSEDSQPLRPVPTPAGELATALPPDARGQVLCQALAQRRWDYLLGGTAKREVRAGGCHVVTADADIMLNLEQTPAALQHATPVDIAGHPGELEFLDPKVNARLNVRLSTAAASDEITPYLRVNLSDSSHADQLTTTVAREVVAAIMSAGQDLPPVGPDGEIPMPQGDLPPGQAITDSPWPVIAWQLCAHLVKELGGTPQPRFDGQCTVRGIQAVYTDAASPRAYPGTLAGRPALITSELVAIKLTDDSAQVLTFTGSGRNLRTLAERLLPTLLGR